MEDTAGVEPTITDEELANRTCMDADTTDDVCWICLDDSHDNRLMSPCKCPRKVHPKCLARWQLQQAGKAEETHCRFCNSALADWKSSLTPENLKPDVQKVQPIMVVYFEGEIHRIPVKQGPDGLGEFTSRIRELFRLPEDVDISLTFGCKEPMSGQHLKLEGIGAFDAAVHCASVAAAERQHKSRTNSPACSMGGGPAGPSGAQSPTVGGAEQGGEGAPEAVSPVAPGAHPAPPQPLRSSRNVGRSPLAPAGAPLPLLSSSASCPQPLQLPPINMMLPPCTASGRGSGASGSGPTPMSASGSSLTYSSSDVATPPTAADGSMLSPFHTSHLRSTSASAGLTSTAAAAAAAAAAPPARPSSTRRMRRSSGSMAAGGPGEQGGIVSMDPECMDDDNNPTLTGMITGRLRSTLKQLFGRNKCPRPPGEGSEASSPRRATYDF